MVAALAVAGIFISPPRVWLNMTKSVEPSSQVGADRVEGYECRRCHRIGGTGGLKGPNLQGITRAVGDPANVSLRLWLRDPGGVKPNTAMPNFHLSDTEIEAILAYLAELDAAES